MHTTKTHRNPLALAATLCLGAALALTGCGGGSAEPGDVDSGTSGDGPAPTFSLAWSEYPSWSTFGVAEERGLIDGAKGAQGPIERKHNIDIELNLTDYDTCLNLYGSGTVDAVCITNMDVLAPSLGVRSVAVLPTSTSVGADALIVTDEITEIGDLRGRKTYGLAKSVSEYTFARNLELAGEDPDQFEFSNMDPGAAAVAMQTGSDDHQAIVVWNPFVLQTLENRADTKVLFDSSTIPGEIIDMVVVSQASLDKPGGDRFALALAEAFYTVSGIIESPDTRDEALVQLGAKFSSLGLDTMKQVVEQTQFYKTPGAGLELFLGQSLPDVMPRVVEFCIARDIVTDAPNIQYGADAGDDANLVFDPTFMEMAAESAAAGG